MHIPQNQKEWDSIAEIKFGKIFHWILKNERAFGRMMLEFEDIIFDKDRCPIMSHYISRMSSLCIKSL